MVILKRNLKLLIFFLIFIVIAPIIVLYANGDIFSDGWNLLPTGGIYVSHAPVESSVFLNGKLKDTTSFFGRNVLIRNLPPGTYEVSVKKNGYSPWDEKISVANNLVANADVFMAPTQIIFRAITRYTLVQKRTATSTVNDREKNPEYAAVLGLFADVPAPSATAAFASSTIDFSGNLGTERSPVMQDRLGLWQKDGNIYVAWFGDDDTAPEYLCDQSDCVKPLIAYRIGAPATRIGFLPGYANVILIASGNKIFAVQAENYPTKTPYIIYQGSHPDFRVSDGNLYIKDNGVLSEATF